MRLRLAAQYTLVVIIFASVSLTVMAQGKYCGSRESSVYHYPSCRYVQQIKPENLIWFKDEYEAVAKGYRPCKVCEPPYPGQTTTTTTKTSTYASISTLETTTGRYSTVQYTTSRSTTTPFQTPTSSWYTPTRTLTATSSQVTPTPTASEAGTASSLASKSETIATSSSPLSTRAITATTTPASSHSTIMTGTTDQPQPTSVADRTMLATGLSLGIVISLVALGMWRTRPRIKSKAEPLPLKAVKITEKRISRGVGLKDSESCGK